jgi:multiple sugar transport system substrate-binding protein
MDMRRVVSGIPRLVLLGSLAVSALLTGSVAARASTPVTITVAGCWTDAVQGPAFTRVVQTFNRTQNQIRVVGTWNNSFSKVLTQQLGGNPPDVYFDCSTGQVGTWAKNRYIKPLAPYIAASHWNPGVLTPSARSFVTYQGQIWAMPFLEDTFMLLFNKTLFRKAGLDPNKPPATWEQMRADADKMTLVGADGRMTQAGMLPTYAGNDFVGTWLPVYVAGFGGHMTDSTGTHITANCLPCISALQWERAYYDRWGATTIDRFQSRFTGGQQYSGPGNAFLSGSTAMAIEGEYYVKQEQVYKAHLDYGVAPMPYSTAHPELAGTGMAGGNPGMIMAGSKHPDQAFAFLRWVETLPPTISFANTINNVPQLRAAVDSRQLDPNPKFRAFVSWAQSPKIAVFPVIAVQDELATELTQVEDKVLHGKMTAKAGLDQVTTDIQARMSGNGVP